MTILRNLAAIVSALTATAVQAAPASVDDYMAQAAIPPDSRIAYGPAPAQVVDLFLPKGRGPHPVVVLIHGGCFLAKFEGLTQTSGIAADLARRGYAVWNVEYRKLGEPGAGYPGTFQDVAAAVDRIRVEAARYHLDTGRVIAVGHSAGGHLALWAAGRGRLPSNSPLRTDDPLKIGAVVALAGIGDLEGQGRALAMPCGDDTLERLIDISGRAKPYADTSPAELLPMGIRAVMVHGAYDHVLPPYIGRDYAVLARAAGDPVEVMTLPDAGHFDLVIVTTPAWKAVVRTIAREFARIR